MHIFVLYLMILFAIPLMTGCMSGKVESEEKTLQTLQDINRNLGAIEVQLAGIKAVDGNLVQINNTVQETGQRLASLEQTIRNTNPGKIDIDALREVNLPANPSRDQVEEYIQMIINVSKNQYGYSPNDPQVRMLTKVGRNNLDLLIKHQDDFYAGAAIGKLVTGDDKELILKHISKDYCYYPATLKIVSAMGWAKDAKTQLLLPLKIGLKDFPPELIEAVASMQDQETYPYLVEYFVDSSRLADSMRTYQAIKKLPGIKIDGAVDKLWQYAKDTENIAPSGKNIAAYYATEHGSSEALEYLINTLACPQATMPDQQRGETQTMIWRITAQDKSPAGMLEWFKTNRDKLIFDKNSTTFKPVAVLPASQ